MNKYDFLRKLDRELSPLDQVERRELLAFYEERFYNGTIYENKTEEQVIAELESPEQIARNILIEYGISPRAAKSRQRYIDKEKIGATVNNAASKVSNKFASSNYDASAIIILIVVDLFILSWLIPSLFSVVVSLGGVLISYIGVLGLVVGTYTSHEFMTFLFLTGAYYLVFLLTLAFLDLFIWVLKKSILYHLRVFKYKKYHDVNKKVSKFSVEAWFKRHRFLRFVKNTAGVAAIVLIVFSGIYLASNYDDIYKTYVSDRIVNQEYTFDTATESFTEWDIDVKAENVSVKLIETSGTEFVINRNYVEKDGEVYQVSLEENVITVFHNIPGQVNFWFDIEDFAELFVRDEIIIELPAGVNMEDVTIQTSNAKVEINTLTATLLDVETSNAQVEVSGSSLDEMSLDTSNGSIILQGVMISGDAELYTSNAQVRVKYSEVGHLEAVSSNGSMVVTNVISDYIYLDTSNAGVSLEEITTTSGEAVLIIDTSNGSVDLENVYIHTVTIDTSNGGIDYYNDDTLFDIDVTHSTSNGSYEGNVN